MTAAPSPGAELIEEAMRDGAGPIYVAFLGPLTDMASALLLEPRIADRDVTVLWIGEPLRRRACGLLVPVRPLEGCRRRESGFGSRLRLRQIPKRPTRWSG
jgi:hypothetical protein